MAILNLEKGSLNKLSPNFKSFEFDCPCSKCSVTLVDEDLISNLQKLRNYLKFSIVITSGYRCSDYQKVLTDRGLPTAKGISQHELGKAADISCEGFSGIVLEDAARKCGFVSVGVGSNWIHVDLRNYKRWVYENKERENDGTIRVG